jgi:hypothetical protein
MIMIADKRKINRPWRENFGMVELCYSEAFGAINSEGRIFPGVDTMPAD